VIGRFVKGPMCQFGTSPFEAPTYNGPMMWTRVAPDRRTLPAGNHHPSLVLGCCAGYMHELTHGQFNRMTTGEQVGTAAAGLALGGILYEVRGEVLAQSTCVLPGYSSAVIHFAWAVGQERAVRRRRLAPAGQAGGGRGSSGSCMSYVLSPSAFSS